MEVIRRIFWHLVTCDHRGGSAYDYAGMDWDEVTDTLFVTWRCGRCGAARVRCCPGDYAERNPHMVRWICSPLG